MSKKTPPTAPAGAQAETLLETILEYTHVLIAYLDADFNFIKVNRAYAAADEKEPSYFPGKNHFALFPNEENEKIFQMVARTGAPYFTHAKPFEYDENPNRGVSYWDWSLIPVKGEDGKTASLVLSLTDATERCVTEQLKDRYANELAERVRELDCLYAISNLIADRGEFLEETFEGVADLLPGGRHYPARARSRIVYEGKEYRCADFSESGQSYSCNIRVNGRARGSVDIFFFDDSGAGQSRPQAESNNLIDTIASRLGKVAETIEAETEIRRFMKLAEIAKYGIAVFDLDGVLTYTNDYFARKHGYSVNEALGKHFSILHTEDSFEYISEIFKETIASGSLESIEVPHKHLDGHEFPMLMNLTALKNARGEVEAIAKTAMDITKIKDNEEELKRHRDDLEKLVAERSAELLEAYNDLRLRESFLAAIFEAIQDGLCVLDINGTILRANHALEKWHSDHSPLAGKKCYETYCLIGERSTGSCPAHRVIDSKKTEQEIIARATSDGRGVRLFDVVCFPLANQETGEVYAVIESSRDITDRLVAEKEIEENKALMTELARKLISAHEEERGRLSRELHDQMGKMLTAISLELALAQTGGAGSMERLAQLVEKSASDLRAICRGLRPPMLDSMGIETAMEALCREFESYSAIKVTHDIRPVGNAALPDEHIISMYRVLQEALTNVARHSNAGNVKVSLSNNGKAIILEVRDDGDGFNDTNPGHPIMKLGVAGMKERAALCGGWLEIESSRGKGAAVIMRVPLKQTATGEEK